MERGNCLESSFKTLRKKESLASQLNLVTYETPHLAKQKKKKRSKSKLEVHITGKDCEISTLIAGCEANLAKKRRTTKKLEMENVCHLVEPNSNAMDFETYPSKDVTVITMEGRHKEKKNKKHKKKKKEEQKNIELSSLTTHDRDASSISQEESEQIVDQISRGKKEYTPYVLLEPLPDSNLQSISSSKSCKKKEEKKNRRYGEGFLYGKDKAEQDEAGTNFICMGVSDVHFNTGQPTKFVGNAASVLVKHKSKKKKDRKNVLTKETIEIPTDNYALSLDRQETQCKSSRKTASPFVLLENLSEVVPGRGQSSSAEKDKQVKNKNHCSQASSQDLHGNWSHFLGNEPKRINSKYIGEVEEGSSEVQTQFGNLNNVTKSSTMHKKRKNREVEIKEDDESKSTKKEKKKSKKEKDTKEGKYKNRTKIDEYSQVGKFMNNEDLISGNEAHISKKVYEPCSYILESVRHCPESVLSSSTINALQERNGDCSNGIVSSKMHKKKKNTKIERKEDDESKTTKNKKKKSKEEKDKEGKHKNRTKIDEHPEAGKLMDNEDFVGRNKLLSSNKLEESSSYILESEKYGSKDPLCITSIVALEERNQDCSNGFVSSKIHKKIKNREMGRKHHENKPTKKEKKKSKEEKDTIQGIHNNRTKIDKYSEAGKFMDNEDLVDGNETFCSKQLQESSSHILESEKFGSKYPLSVTSVGALEKRNQDCSQKSTICQPNQKDHSPLFCPKTPDSSNKWPFNISESQLSSIKSQKKSREIKKKKSDLNDLSSKLSNSQAEFNNDYTIVDDDIYEIHKRDEVNSIVQNKRREKRECSVSKKSSKKSYIDDIDMTFCDKSSDLSSFKSSFHEIESSTISSQHTKDTHESKIQQRDPPDVISEKKKRTSSVSLEIDCSKRRKGSELVDGTLEVDVTGISEKDMTLNCGDFLHSSQENILNSDCLRHQKSSTPKLSKGKKEKRFLRNSPLSQKISDAELPSSQESIWHKLSLDSNGVFTQTQESQKICSNNSEERAEDTCHHETEDDEKEGEERFIFSVDDDDCAVSSSPDMPMERAAPEIEESSVSDIFQSLEEPGVTGRSKLKGLTQNVIINPDLQHDDDSHLFSDTEEKSSSLITSHRDTLQHNNTSKTKNIGSNTIWRIPKNSPSVKDPDLLKHAAAEAGKYRRAVNSDGRIKCPDCDRTYKNQFHLNYHIKRNHFNLKMHHCDICDKVFGEKQTLVVHQRVHTNDRPFSCRLCHKNYVSMSHLNRHYKNVHSLMKEFLCETCDISYCFEGDLKNHMAVHRKPLIM